jgi:hypothetical protein
MPCLKCGGCTIECYDVELRTREWKCLNCGGRPGARPSIETKCPWLSGTTTTPNGEYCDHDRVITDRYRERNLAVSARRRSCGVRSAA